MQTEPKRLTNIDLSGLSLGERLSIYRGSPSFVSGPLAAGYVDDATVIELRKRSVLFTLFNSKRTYRLRYKDNRICRIPNGETTMLYVHARGGRPTVSVYLTDSEYVLVKKLLAEEALTPASPRSHRNALRALERIEFHENLRNG